jgi:hypothetical protein
VDIQECPACVRLAPHQHSSGSLMTAGSSSSSGPSSTLATKFGRLLISTLPPVVLLTMLSTVTDAQAIDKERSVKPQAKDISVKPQAKDISVKPQAKANARSLSAGDASSQKMIRTGDTGAADIEATSGSYQLVTGSQGERSYHVRANNPPRCLSQP